jgi:citrate synthase
MSSGLEGVVAAETILSHTDQNNGMVWGWGHSLPTLVARYGFAGTVALLWDGFAGTGLTHHGIRAIMGTGRETAFASLDHWLDRAAGRPLFEGGGWNWRQCRIPHRGRACGCTDRCSARSAARFRRMRRDAA